MRVAILGVLSLVAVEASADSSLPPQKGFWNVLVKAEHKWTLRRRDPEPGAPAPTIVVETYDARKIGAADVARLRWTHVRGKKQRVDIGNSADGRYTQLAVTPSGLYLLTADMDDAKIAEALKRRPSRSDPPKPYKASNANDGRFLKIVGNGGESVVCMGQGPVEPEEGCVQDPDECYGEVCFSAAKGPVSLTGNWSPDRGEYAQPGYE